MPVFVQWIAEIFPATHYIRISRAIYLRGEGALRPAAGARPAGAVRRPAAAQSRCAASRPAHDRSHRSGPSEPARRPPLPLERHWPSPTRKASALRHDQAFLGAVLIQPVMMLLLFGFALSNKPANVPWVVLDQNRTAASRALSRSGAVDRLLPAAAVRWPATTAGQTLLQARHGGRLRRRADRLPPRPSSAGGRRCRCCSTAPTRSPRRASAATSARSAPPTACGRTPTRAAAAASTCSSASASTRPCATASSSSPRWPACCSPTSACR